VTVDSEPFLAEQHQAASVSVCRIEGDLGYPHERDKVKPATVVVVVVGVYQGLGLGLIGVTAFGF
jgi:hypothetical protein